MTIKRVPVVMEITDDAYKQNSVYRPWDEDTANETVGSTATSLTQQQAVETLAAVSRVLAAAGISG